MAGVHCFGRPQPQFPPLRIYSTISSNTLKTPFGNSTQHWHQRALPNNMSQYSGKIVFYEGKCFTGRKLEVSGPCENFQERGFTNRVHSVCVRTGAWLCFSHADFRGQQYVLEHGEYPGFYSWNAHNDRMGSCKPVGMHGEHYRIEIFEGRHFSGLSQEFTEDCSFLSRQGWDKKWINAIKVYGDGAWVLYEEPNYRGQMYLVERGDYSSCNEWQAASANIQSLRRVINHF